jgi:serine/threonine protein kinase
MSNSDPLIGKQLGDYTIQGLLGRGGMSRVYRGYDENLDRYAAVKVISGDFATTSEEEYTRRFQIEARAIARLRHPNIVGVYQFGRTEGIYYMAMVFMEGQDLRALLKDYAMRGKRMPNDEVLRIAQDVASALDYAHAQGVIHRDIKPSNIMMERSSNRAVLMDFGLALSVHEGTTGDTFGSAHYIAPEQAISSANAVPQSDLYSLGIVLYEMIAGKVPFDDPSAMSVALKHLNELPPPPTLYNPQLPPAVEAVIMRALEKEPGKRYRSGQELVGALEQSFKGVKPDDAWPESEAERASSVAQRFAVRRAQREKEAEMESISEADLQIDSDTLGSILDTYADPSEIGLVGPNATGIRRPQAEAPAQEPPRKRRRSRVFLLLFVLVAAAVVAGVILTGGSEGGGDDGGGGEAVALADEDQTATAASGVTTGESATPDASATPTERPTLGPSPLPADSAATEAMTGDATEPVTALETDEVTEAATEAATEVMTEAATEEITEEPVETAVEPSATLTATNEPSATPTSEPSETLTLTSTPEPAPTDTPSPTVTEISQVEPNLVLRYDRSEVLLFNVSSEMLDISRLVFTQELPDGTRRVFEANSWPGSATMDPEGCFQLVRADATRIRPNAQTCPVFLGWFRANITRRYFWIGDDEGMTFTVQVGADAADVLQTCNIDAGECAFFLPPLQEE